MFFSCFIHVHSTKAQLGSLGLQLFGSVGCCRDIRVLTVGDLARHAYAGMGPPVLMAEFRETDGRTWRIGTKNSYWIGGLWHCLYNAFGVGWIKSALIPPTLTSPTCWLTYHKS